jgi:hypothetical protein
VERRMLMDNVSWNRPLVLHDYLALLLSMSGPWPPSRPGVYVVTERLWMGRPSAQTGVLYTGGTKNLLDRIGNLIRDVLGFFGEVEGGPGWVGKHSGAQSLLE